MCAPAACEVCEKTTWRGCGMHVATAMGSVPTDQWCTCGPKTTFEDAEYPPQKGKAQK